MNLFFMGTPEFASVSLKALAQTHNVMRVVCRPDKPAGRGRRLSAPDVKRVARELSIPVLQPESPGEIIAEIKKLKPESVCVVAYGKIIPQAMLGLVRHGFINLHASLLPAYRGTAPINRAVMAGEKKTGVTTMLINEKLDSGDILLQKEVAVRDGEDSERLACRLAAEGAALLIETLAGIEDGSVRPVAQNDLDATYAPILTKEDGRIDWGKPAHEIINKIRGALPWPGAFTVLRGKTLKIFQAAESSGEGKPGEILKSGSALIVAAGSGAVEIKQLQLEGKRRMDAADFLRGADFKTVCFLG